MARSEFPVVAIGASAGGLDALKAFFEAMPADSGLALVIVQHLDPAQPSMLVEILTRFTAMPVAEAGDGVRVEPDHVYVGPPNKVLTLRDGALHLAPVTEVRGKRFPIDTLLRSVAEEWEERAACVILSGTGTDGTAGLAAIKDHGGVAVVQEPETAEFDGMPASAIGTGLADLVLPVEKIPESLLKFSRQPYLFAADSPPAGPGPDDLVSVLALLRVRSNFDFRAYKTSTLARRIQRRMGLAGIERVSEYVNFLRETPDELHRLRRDVLISVTSFFRDPDAFEVIAEKVIPDIVSRKPPETPVRVWVAGCATGAEAYSIAMLLHERHAALNKSLESQIFATDLDEDALSVARAGTYPESSVLIQVSEPRVKRFFVPEEDHRYRVGKELRESIVFAPHNLLTDPPFSKMDLISCRNVLIYLQPEAQKRLMALFHAALNPGGYLFLGSAESVSPESGFEPVSSKWRIYRRVGPPRALHFGFSLGFSPTPMELRTPEALEPSKSALKTPMRRAPSLRDFTVDLLLEEYAPASLLINEKDEALYLHGPVNKYLDLPRGEPNLDVMALVREGLSAPLRVALNQARRENRSVHVNRAHVKRDASTFPVRFRVKPVDAPRIAEGLLLVTFEDAVEPEPPASDAGLTAPHPRIPESDEGIVRQLEAELAAAKAELQNTIEAYETTNEEMKASSEEMMSMNEEFRSTNEELETSKEELQSLNEELSSVNNQLKEKVQSLETTTNDLANLLASTDVATLFLDRDSRIRRFTPAMRKLLSLLPSDTGRPFADIARKFSDERLIPDVERVLHDLAPVETEIRSDEGRWYVRRILPYRTQDNRIEGVVVTFQDVDAQKRVEQRLREAKAYAESIVATLRGPLVVLDKNLRVKSANRAFYDKFGATPSTTEGQFIYDLGNRQWDIPELRTLLETTLPKRLQIHDFEVQHDFEGLGRRAMRLNAKRLVIQEDGDEKEVLILLAIEDVTAHKARESHERHLKQELEQGVRERTAELMEANRILRQTNESLDSFSWVVGHDLKEPVRAVEILLGSLDEDCADALAPEARERLQEARKENRRLAELVLGLLEFSRAARVDLTELQPVSVDEVLRGPACATRYRNLLQERGARLEGPDPRVRVRATATGLAQILGNLVLNAVKHNPKPKPAVRVRAFPSREKGMIEIVVEDNGPGFSPAIRSGFESGGDTTHGGGFGLAIARRGVYHLGGTMWLGESAEGGAAVHFTLSASIG